MRRIYEAAAPDDGRRVLVDRLWPRGLSKDRAEIDEWCKPVAPSAQLRTWYAHDPQRFAEFADRYRAELRAGEQAAALQYLRAAAQDGTLTLLTATKQVDVSAAAVLADLLADIG